MKGSIKVMVSTKKLRYELNLRRNITIIQGDSASGKTTLIQIISDYLSGRSGPGIEVVCDKKCAVLTGDMESVEARMKLLKDTVVFVDEQERFLYTKGFAAAVSASDCYFVFVTRDALNMLPYSVNEIYYLKNSGYYQHTRQVYNSMHQVYQEARAAEGIELSVVLTEDSNAGFEMFEAVSRNMQMVCDSARGKSNVGKYMLAHKEDRILAIVDGAAFGADMQSAMHALEVNQKSFLWAPESFEYLILRSNIVQAEGLREILEQPGAFVESGEYSSWERYFNHLLERLTKDTIYAYSKRKLNPNYLTKGNIDKVEKMMKDTLFVKSKI